jgi:sulfate adenylyltransferase
LRIVFLAAELSLTGAAVIAASIAPYTEGRAHALDVVNSGGTGNFFVIYIATPFEYCKGMDLNGRNVKARLDEIKGFIDIVRWFLYLTLAN